MAGFVAKGFIKTFEVDYLKTFAPFAKLSTVRAVIFIAANVSQPFFLLNGHVSAVIPIRCQECILAW